MKRTKRIFAIFMTLALAMSMLIVSSAVSFAANVPTPEGGFTVTITQNPDDKGTHTYEAYQIFSGTLSSETKDGKTVYTLTDLDWGSGIKDADKEGLGSAKTYAEGMSDSNADAKAAELAGHLSTTTSGTYSNGQITGLQPGYYLIQDAATSPVSDSNTTKPAAKTKFILRVVADQTVNAKSSVPSVVKKVQDINDSDATPALSGLQDSADYDIGDTIPYTITGTIGSGIANFDSYSFQFVDEMSKGLTLDQSSWDIKVGDESIKSLFELTSAEGNNGATIWTWAAQDIRDKVQDGSEVVLTYNCTLNKDAVVGSAGNPNEVYLKFDNNPNNSGQGTPGGETPKDKNIVFTYKTVFNKVDKDNNPLTGADFKLEKKVNGEWVDVTTLGSGNNKPTKTGSTAGSTFEFKGLDDGDYKLTETTTPEGYNTIDPIEFTITASHDVTSDDPRLTALTGTGGEEFTMTPDLSEGSLTADVINEKGSTLPETGGIGTIIFYVLGSLLVVGCGIVLISKKRMESR
ncbi:MAG: isopeptide-forming domain-containing fimbrial protein [Mogibacterium sp.]|nr:isopeptide-forming domain-containing fimbrial protein [Mogibacterium sp.]